MKHRTELFSGIRGFAGQLETWEKQCNPFERLEVALKLSRLDSMFLEEIGRPLQCWAAALGQTQGSLKIPPTVVLLLLCPGLSICRGRSFFSFEMSLAGREGALKQGVLISGGGIVLCIMYMGNIPCVEPIYPIVLPDYFFPSHVCALVKGMCSMHSVYQ